MPQTITRETLKQLLAISDKPCLSLFQPTHRSFPEREQDPIRYKHLVRQLEDTLKSQGHAEADKLLEPFRALIDNNDFWNSNGEAIAMFGAPGYFQVFRLSRKVPELAVVNARMHIKPLLRIAQSSDRYQVLALSRDSIRLLEGTRDGIGEIPLAEGVPATLVQALGSDLTEKAQSGFSQGYGRSSERGDPMQIEAGGPGKQAEIDRDRDRFFREIDRALLEHHSRPSGLPLVLAALPEHQYFFRKISHNPFLLDKGVEKDPSLLSVDELREATWTVMEQRYLKRLENLLDQFGESFGQGLATDRIEEIGQSIMEGRVSTLLVEAERQIPGQADASDGKVLPATEQSATTPDLLDELTVWAFEHGGDVIVVPKERMPTQSGVAALYRF